MAVTAMTKVMIVSHRSQASQLLEAMQNESICQVLNADEAVVSKDMPELIVQGQRPKDIEALLNRLQSCIAFLGSFAPAKKGLTSVLSPRTVIDEKSYRQVISDRQIPEFLNQCQQTQAAIEKAKTEIENLNAPLEMLRPWMALETPVEQIGQLKTTTCWAGLIPSRQFEQVAEQITQLGAAVQQVGTAAHKFACLIACLKEQADEVQKLLRCADFEPVSFEPMTGTVAELIKKYAQRLNQTKKQLLEHYDKAESLSENLLKLEILYDHYHNLLNREQAKDTAPATEHTVILEGWVKHADFPRLQKIVSRFEAASVTKIQPAEDEKIPVEIENKRPWRPFEVITRLYGMPQHFEVDPTAFLAPFFAIFFALCLTDAGYGLVIIALMVFFIRKLRGDKKLMWMLGICSAVTVLAGALTGGWFGDAVQQFIPSLEPLRKKLMWFDPLQDPMIFFKLALALGYIQIMFGLTIAFGHKIKQQDFVSAICDHLTWLVMLNLIVLVFASKVGAIPPVVGKIAGPLAAVPAAVILMFSHREGSWLARIGMGTYNLFSTIFYMGDVLSYLRLMALGMVTAGLAMAINVIAKIAGQIPYGIGIFAMVLVLIGGHTFNIAINALGAFVHTLRLQYVEFFPKFFVGGGKAFQPLTKKYPHIYIKKSNDPVR